MLPLPMQDSLPAGWLAFIGWELNPLGRNERFPRCYIFFPFPGFILTLREFIALFGGGAIVAWPCGLHAQQLVTPTIAVVSFANRETTLQSSWYNAFHERLLDLGWAPGRNLTIEYRFADEP